MGFKITARTDFSGEHMGLVFLCGAAYTDDTFLASRLRSKGYTVTDENSAAEIADDLQMGAPGEESEDDSGEFPDLPPLYETDFLDDFEHMTVAQLRDHAAENGIDLGSAKTKADIIAVISGVTE